MPENRRASIIAALQANPNSRQVAREIGVNQVTVWKIAKAEGIELTAGRAASGQLTADRRAFIVAALKANPNSRQVAREIGVSQVTVWTIAKAEGIELPVRGRPSRAPDRRSVGTRSTDRRAATEAGSVHDHAGRGDKIFKAFSGIPATLSESPFRGDFRSA